MEFMYEKARLQIASWDQFAALGKEESGNLVGRLPTFVRV